MKRHLTLVSALLLACAPAAFAGIHYTADTLTESGKQRQKMTVEGWVDGAGAKIVFTEAGTPLMKKGSYVVTEDGGETIYLVDPEEKTYVEWDLEALLQGLGGMMQAMGGMVDVQVDGVEVDNLDSGAGPAMHGLPTAYRKYSLSYDLRIKVMGMTRESRVETVNEVWSTDALDDVALGLWLRDAPTTGFEAVDELIAAQQGQATGFPLKTVTTSTTTGKKGKQQDSSTTTMVVTSLDREASIPPATFKVPEGYTRSEAPAAAGEGEGNPFKGLFGGGKG